MNLTTTPVREDRFEHVTGLIERVTFHNPESGFAVLRVKVRGHRDLVSVVGTLPSVTPGEWVDVRGQWTVDREHGRFLKSTESRYTEITPQIKIFPFTHSSRH